MTVYIDTSAIEEIANKGDGIVSNFEKTIETIKKALPKDAVRERKVLDAQLSVNAALLANNVDPKKVEKILAENSVAATVRGLLAQYVTEDGKLNLTEEQAEALWNDMQRNPDITVQLAEGGAEVVLGDQERAKLQFWGGVEIVKQGGASFLSSLQFALDLSGEAFYYASGELLYQASHERFHETVNDVVNGIAAMVSHPQDFTSAIVQDYKDRYAYYEELKEEGKYKEAGKVMGALTHDVGETLAAAGVAGAGILKGTKNLAGLLDKVVAKLIGRVDLSLLEEMAQNGIKHTPEDVLFTHKMPDGTIVFLEKGSANGGLKHIVAEHVGDFARKGISEAELSNFLFETVKNGKVVGYQGQGMGRPIYEVFYKGKKYNVGVTIGNNGFVVGANPR